MIPTDENLAFSRRVRDIILPFWAAEGVDPSTRLFWERFDRTGKPKREAPRRLMVQARQCYVYSHAALTGIGPAGGDETAVAAFDRTLHAFSESRDLRDGLAFSVSPEGRVLDETRDAYSHAFALFGLASVLRLTGEVRYQRAVEALLQFVDARLADTVHGGISVRSPDAPPWKDQNPLMHLLEAWLALHEAWPERGFLDRATNIVRLAVERLLDHPTRVLLERYTSDWSPRLDQPDGRVFEPGHQFEWTWLLAWYDRLAGTDHGAAADRLWTTAVRSGRDGVGLCFDEVAIGGEPVKRSARLWPHCEGVRAAAFRQQAGDAAAAAVLEDMLRHINGRFLGRPFEAGWTDRLDEAGRPMELPVPASSLYHVYGAFLGATAR